jgi:RNA ligase
MQVDVANLQRLVDERYISVQKHPTLPLLIWNYTPKTQFENHWTPETMMCRGLITRLKPA